MAKLAVSQLPREAAQINSGDRFLIDQPSVINPPVIETQGDTRQVSLEVIAGALTGQESVIDFADEKVSEETSRAEAA
jgi:hypothetical protein